VRAIRPTVILDNERPRSGVPAREIGADTRQVLAGAGFAEAEIADLLEAGAARAPQSGAR
jgi:crotonobetainyl-CoA:carnitine CoA-transferase CaiB-like acyl-CoA transferase